jgi:hypothetical protein
LLQPGDHRVEVTFGDLRRHAAQHVVGAEFQDDEIGILRYGPIETREPAARRIPRNAGIHDHDIVTLRPHGLLELFRKALAGIQTVSSHQAVSEADDLVRLGRGRRRQADEGQSRAGQRTRGRFESHAARPICRGPSSSI